MSSPPKKRVVLFGTHPHQFNGYSKVVYQLTRALEMWRSGEAGDIDTHIFGFQNFYANAAHDRVLQRTKVYDPFAVEEPRQQGFGFGLVKAYAEAVKPHLCVVYNDMLVVSNIIQGLIDARAECGYPKKIAVYADQVYECQKPHYIEMLNTHADSVIVFSPYWENCIRGQGIRPDLPLHVLAHGFDTSRNFPIPPKYARMYLGIAEDDFVVLNLNRNQPRKRWDICIKAMCRFIAQHISDPVKFIVATAASSGAWDLNELFFLEFRKHGISMNDGMAHVITIDKPQLLADDDINVLYNACDVGINTCDGEGFGLCNFEQAGVGVPQIVPRVGGFIDIFDDECALFVDPVVSYYVDSSRDGVGGEARMCRDVDFADALEKYYTDPELRRKHGKAARQRVLTRFQWPDVARQYEGIVDACLALLDADKVGEEPVRADVHNSVDHVEEHPQEVGKDVVVDSVDNDQSTVVSAKVSGAVEQVGDAPKKRTRRHPRKHARDKKRADKHPQDLDDVEAECKRLMRRLKKLKAAA